MSDLWELPTTWCWTSIGDVTDVIGGGTPSTTNPKNFEGSIPWITPADMSGYSGKSISGGARFISEQGLEDSGARWLPEGTVLFSSRAPIGYVAIASRPVTTNQGFKSFVPGYGLNSDYLYYWLTSAKQRAEALASGTTFLELSGAKAALITLPLAPTAEQTRIVAKLEELLSDLDAGVAELKAAQKKLKQYRQSLLKAAVEGALTAEWRAEHTPTETGAELLQRILTERRACWEAKQLAKFKEQSKTPPKDWQKKYPEPVQPDVTELPLLPEGWVWASVDQLTPDDLANGRSVPTAEVGAKVLRLTAVKEGKIDLRECKIGAWSDEDAKQFAVVEGDLLIVRGNGSLTLVGRAGLVGHVAGQVAYPDTMIRLRVVDAVVSPSWVGLVWDSNVVRSHMERRARTSAGIYKISQPDIVSAPVPVPGLSEQARIGEAFAQQLDQISAAQTALEMGLRQSTAQRQNILRAAFTGQLVPQDLNDEPASVLLARIRAERAERDKQPKVRKTKKQKEIAAVVSKLIDVLAEADDWVSAQEAFRRCGVADGALTDQIEVLYAELRALDKAGRLVVEAVTDAQGRKLHDRLKLLAN